MKQLIKQECVINQIKLIFDYLPILKASQAESGEAGIDMGLGK